jgi:hypothetical protein
MRTLASSVSDRCHSQIIELSFTTVTKISNVFIIIKCLYLGKILDINVMTVNDARVVIYDCDIDI